MLTFSIWNVEKNLNNSDDSTTFIFNATNLDLKVTKIVILIKS